MQPISKVCHECELHFSGIVEFHKNNEGPLKLDQPLILRSLKEALREKKSPAAKSFAASDFASPRKIKNRKVLEESFKSLIHNAAKRNTKSFISTDFEKEHPDKKIKATEREKEEPFKSSNEASFNQKNPDYKRTNAEHAHLIEYISEMIKKIHLLSLSSLMCGEAKYAKAAHQLKENLSLLPLVRKFDLIILEIDYIWKLFKEGLFIQDWKTNQDFIYQELVSNPFFIRLYETKGVSEFFYPLVSIRSFFASSSVDRAFDRYELVQKMKKFYEQLPIPERMDPHLESEGSLGQQQTTLAKKSKEGYSTTKTPQTQSSKSKRKRSLSTPRKKSEALDIENIKKEALSSPEPSPTGSLFSSSESFSFSIASHRSSSFCDSSSSHTDEGTSSDSEFSCSERFSFDESSCTEDEASEGLVDEFLRRTTRKKTAFSKSRIISQTRLSRREHKNLEFTAKAGFYLECLENKELCSRVVEIIQTAFKFPLSAVYLKEGLGKMEEKGPGKIKIIKAIPHHLLDKDKRKQRRQILRMLERIQRREGIFPSQEK
jgi:hypothetical protein